jgi:hypothetical protein
MSLGYNYGKINMRLNQYSFVYCVGHWHAGCAHQSSQNGYGTPKKFKRPMASENVQISLILKFYINVYFLKLTITGITANIFSNFAE